MEHLQLVEWDMQLPEGGSPLEKDNPPQQGAGEDRLLQVEGDSPLQVEGDSPLQAEGDMLQEAAVDIHRPQGPLDTCFVVGRQPQRRRKEVVPAGVNSPQGRPACWN